MISYISESPVASSFKHKQGVDKNVNFSPPINTSEQWAGVARGGVLCVRM